MVFSLAAPLSAPLLGLSFGCHGATTVPVEGRQSGACNVCCCSSFSGHRPGQPRARSSRPRPGALGVHCYRSWVGLPSRHS
jgi:hypothetical protein